MVLSESNRLRQAGMVLVISLVFLLLVSLVGLSSMQGALIQQKIAGSVWQRNQSLQRAESGLRLGEAAVQRSFTTLPLCQSITRCAPPEAAFSVSGPGADPVSGVSWVALKGGVYGLQSLGSAVGVAHLPPHIPASVYRVTAVGLSGQLRTVLESVYARVEEQGGSRFRRVAWRQLQ